MLPTFTWGTFSAGGFLRVTVGATTEDLVVAGSYELGYLEDSSGHGLGMADKLRAVIETHSLITSASAIYIWSSDVPVIGISCVLAAGHEGESVMIDWPGSTVNSLTYGFARTLSGTTGHFAPAGCWCPGATGAGNINESRTVKHSVYRTAPEHDPSQAYVVTRKWGERYSLTLVYNVVPAAYIWGYRLMDQTWAERAGRTLGEEHNLLEELIAADSDGDEIRYCRTAGNVRDYGDGTGDYLVVSLKSGWDVGEIAGSAAATGLGDRVVSFSWNILS